MQQLVILLIVSCSSTCFGRLYAHHQEVRLHFTACGFLSCKRKTVWSILLWMVELYCIFYCIVYPPQWRHRTYTHTQRLYSTVPPSITQHFIRFSFYRTENHRQWNAVWPPDDGRKDARNMLRNSWLPIKSPIVASSWSCLYLLFIYSTHIYLHMKMEQSVPKRRHINTRRRELPKRKHTTISYKLTVFQERVIAQRTLYDGAL